MTRRVGRGKHRGAVSGKPSIAHHKNQDRTRSDRAGVACEEGVGSATLNNNRESSTTDNSISVSEREGVEGEARKPVARSQFDRNLTWCMKTPIFRSAVRLDDIDSFPSFLSDAAPVFPTSPSSPSIHRELVSNSWGSERPKYPLLHPEPSSLDKRAMYRLPLK